MLGQLLVYFVAVNIRIIYSSLCVTRVIVRVPKEHDIGLIFDLTVLNSHRDKNEKLEFTINGDGCCVLNISHNKQFRSSSRIFGGDFGSIEPGKLTIISLVWPTVSLYNRVGYCPITISAFNYNNEVTETKQLLHFDTRFETLDPHCQTLRKHKDYVECKNWDMDYYNNCRPLNCEERYFGQRSFYNYKTDNCEPVVPCTAQDSYYDYYANECVEMNSFIAEEEMEQLKQGKFDDNFLELRTELVNTRKESFSNKETVTNQIKKLQSQYKQSKASKECNFDGKLALIDFNNCFQRIQEEPSTDQETFNINSPIVNSKSLIEKRQQKKSILSRLYYDWYLPLREDDDGDDENLESNHSDADVEAESKLTSGSKNNELIKEWILYMLLFLLVILSVIMFQIVAILLMYFIVACSVYLCLWIISKCSHFKEETTQTVQRLMPPEEHQENMRTVKSLLSEL